MDTGSLIWTYFFLISVCVCAVSEGPIATTVINCDGGGHKDIGPVDEGFSGDVELVTGITAGSNVKLVPYIFPFHLMFLELNFTVGETTAIVHTNGPLDAEMLIDYNRTLYYSIMCDGELKYQHTRKLKITDLNDHAPVFIGQPHYKIVSEAEPVNTIVLQVKAEDPDITPVHNEVTYSMVPTSEDFIMTSSGALILKRPLNYTLVQTYHFTVTAMDSGGLSDRDSITIEVWDPDNLNPYFSTRVYFAYIPENHVGRFYSIEPEAIKALPGNTGINTTLTYSISSVTPEKYRANFNIDSSSGVMSVVTAMDREEMGSSISVIFTILAVDQVTDGLTARAQVRVQVWDVNEAPQFPPEVYNASVFSNDSYKTPVIRVKASDPDFIDKSQLYYSLVSGSPYFDVDASSGLVFVVSVANLSGQVATVEVKVTDLRGLHATAKVEVRVQVVDVNEAPQFPSEVYKASVFSTDPYKTPVIQVKASDPDVEDEGKLYYSLVSGSPYFDVDASSGLVFVVSVANLSGQVATVEVKVTDPKGLNATAKVEVYVQVEDVNEAPQFPPEVYKASVFSTDPYNTPVIQVKASDPDVGDEGQLEYSLVSGSPYFDVDVSSGLVFVVSVVDLSGQAAVVEVKVTDPKGLNATAKVEVEVLGSTSSSDVVTISLNQPANVVERNIPEMEKSLGKALGWTVDIIEVSNSTRESPKSRTLREAAKSLVNFIAVDKVEVVSYEEVVKKLHSESAAVTAELTKVFGEDVQFAVVERPKDPDSDNLALIISLGVIVPVVIILVLIFVLHRTGSFRDLINFGKKTEVQAMKMDRQSNRRQ